MERVTAADANREFSALLRRVRAGESFVVTSHGKPVAKIVPADDKSAEERRAARERLLAHLDAQPVRHIGPWTRESLYERDGDYHDEDKS